MPDRRLKAVWDVRVPVIRELAGVHEYDGVVMDLSPGGRKAALGRLGCASPGARLADRHDESHLTAAEQAAHAEAEAGLLRWNPLPHIQNLDVSCYDREYAAGRVFFQAEDGIRDTSVTGVQTCALPISDRGVDLAKRDLHCFSLKVGQKSRQ